MPNDPAIMQMQPQNQMGHQGFQPQGFPVPVMGPQMGQFGAPYGPMGYMAGMGGTGLAPGSSGLSAALAKQKQSELNSTIPEPTQEHKDQGVTVIFCKNKDRVLFLMFFFFSNIYAYKFALIYSD